ncbi:MAG: right-handed parallel beta-helix repeat-containing protein [Clostridia bacterium]|nr:right-handed parallel beta-helix repeat-containing protein [Clostridia bacterium]
MLKKVFWVMMMMALLFCTAAAAEEVPTFQVTTLQQLAAAVEEINAAAAATPEGQTAPLYKVRIMNDITGDGTMVGGVMMNFGAGVRVIVEGTDGKMPVLTMDYNALKHKYTAFIEASEGAWLSVNNLIVDFKGSKKALGAAGVLGTGAEISVTDCTFRNLEDCYDGWWTYVRCPVSAMEGSVVVKNCVFEDNHSFNFFPGTGCVSAYGADVTVEDSTFRNNGYENAYGSCINVMGVQNNLDVKGCTFTGNAYPQSPCISAYGVSATVRGCKFTENASPHSKTDARFTSDGAGAAKFSKCDVLIDDCTFSKNTTDLSGGALLLMYGTSAKITNSIFDGNEAVTHGGAICVADFFSENEEDISTLTVENTTFTGNIAKCRYDKADHRGDNFAPGGGAIYVHPACKLTLGKGTVLRGNEAQKYGNGGAVYASYDGMVTIDGAIIENNKAAAHGGAVYLEGAGDFAGEQGSHDDPDMAPPKSYGKGAVLTMNDGLIAGNHAALSGGAVYAAGQTMANQTEYRGAQFIMKGGVITANQADDMGGGVYVQADDEGAQAGEFTMTGGAVYFNVAGENGNTSTGAADAGAEVYCEGDNATISVVSAADITRYIQNPANAFVPAKDRQVWFTNWYDDYSDQCPAYGKSAGKQGTGVNTGRYMSSLTIDRMVYQPLANDSAYNALILDRETQLKLHKQEKSASEMKGQYFMFEITLPSLPPVDLAGKLYPVTFTQNVICPSVSTLPDGRPAIDLSGGKVTLFMKSGDNLEIGGLPAGTQFKIVETDHAGLPDVDISSGNVVTPDINLPKYVITGSTVTSWNDGRTRSDVFYHNNVNDLVPSTGDESRPLLWLALCLLSAGMLCAARRKVNG